MSVTPNDASARVCAGIDWAKDDHAVCIADADAEVLDRFIVKHTAAGLKQLIRRLLGAGVSEVGIERGDGPVVEALLAAGLVVLVIAPNQLKNLRSRYGSAGNKDDRHDAYVLADVIRTDRRRLTPLTRSTPATIALRSSVRARRDLVEHRVTAATQLRAHLQIVLPAMVGLFADLDSQVSLAFLERFTTQTKIDWLTPTRLVPGWPRSATPASHTRRAAPAPARRATRNHPRRRRGPRGDHTRIRRRAAQPEPQIGVLADSIAEHRDPSRRPHREVAARAGTPRAARLLAEIGDARGRFPTADTLACLAGVAPSTRQSGKVKAVTFRWSADKELRDALCDFAGDCRRANPWAENLYQQARARGHDHPHAVRILAHAWANIIWRCWQDGVAYDPARHNALQRLLNKHLPKAA